MPNYKKPKKEKKIVSDRSVTLSGVFSKNPKGFGFVITEDEEGDIFISPPNIHHAMNGDLVEVELLGPAETDRRREGRVRTVLRHANREVVGTFQKEKHFGFIIPDDVKNDNDVFVNKSDFGGARNGEKVVAKITKWPTGSQSAEGRITECLGMPGDPSTELKCLIRQYKLFENFPHKVLEEANSIPDFVSEKDLEKREDLREKTIITIDGADAKDLDDAISVDMLPSGNYLLGVHIADVSHYVKESTKLDRHALKRGCSVYLIDTVLPMLPQNLSNGICSLHPNVDRLTLCVEMEIDKTGNVVSHRIFEGVIRSRERMVYTDVSDILENEDPVLIEKYAYIHEDLKRMGELYHILTDARKQRGSVDFDFDEAYITLNADGIPTDISVSERRLANRLIEEFMLKANETIAEHHFWLDIPFVYRVHESPDPEKIEAFKKFIWNFGYTLKGSAERIHPKALNSIVEAVEGTPHEHIINTIMLRSMRKALYMPDCKGHFGLGLKYYCHFTSPIRRYPDLIIHRIIKENLLSPLGDERKLVLKGKVSEASEISSETERTAQEIERELEKLKKAQYMMEYIDEELEGIISGVTSFGIFVELPNTIEGLIRFSSIHDDHYTFEKEKYRAIGDKTGKIYSLGDPIKVIVDDVDISMREVIFGLVSE